MALVVKDRVRETTTTLGTGTVTLGGAVAGFQAFSVIGNGNTTYYTISDPATGAWEVGIGTYTSSGTTLSRDTVLESSNSNNLVNFGAGTKDVFVTYPADRSVTSDVSTTFTAAQTFRAANAVRSEAAATQDAVVVAGRAGGTNSYAVTLTPTTLTASRTFTFPDADGTALYSGGPLGTPSSGTLSSCSGLPISTGVSGLGTGVATALAVNTGTAGAFVVNGGALGTPSSGTVTNLTGTASININGTVGATTPNTGAFTTLTANNTVTFNQANANTSLAPTGTGTVTINPATAGTINNMAIGGSTAAAGSFTSLTDSGNLTFTGTGNRITGDFSNATITNRTIFQTSTTNATTALSFIPNGTGTTSSVNLHNGSDPANASYAQLRIDTSSAQVTATYLGTGSYLPLVFNTGGSERMRIDTSGNVGIGTSSPGAWIDVFAPDATTSKIRIGNYGAGAGASYPMIESFGCRNDSNGGFFGRFGAAYRRSDGTAIASGAILGGYAFGGQYGTSTGYTAANLLYTAGVFGVAEGSFTGSTAMATAITFCTGSTGASSTNFGTFGTERMRIDSSGNVGIGTSSPGGKLQSISGSATTPALLAGHGGTLPSLTAGTQAVFHGSLGNTTYGLRIALLGGSSGSATINFGDEVGDSPGYITYVNGSEYFVFGTNSAERLRIDSSGNVGIGTSSPDNTANYKTLSINGTTGGQITWKSSEATKGYAYNDGTNMIVGANAALIFATTLASSERMRIDSSGNVRVGTAALATTATDGFLYVPTCAGTPTGTPTAITGLAPIVINTTNNKLYFYSGGAWRDAGP